MSVSDPNSKWPCTMPGICLVIFFHRTRSAVKKSQVGLVPWNIFPFTACISYRTEAYTCTFFAPKVATWSRVLCFSADYLPIIIGVRYTVILVEIWINTVDSNVWLSQVEVWFPEWLISMTIFLDKLVLLELVLRVFLLTRILACNGLGKFQQPLHQKQSVF